MTAGPTVSRSRASAFKASATAKAMAVSKAVAVAGAVAGAAVIGVSLPVGTVAFNILRQVAIREDKQPLVIDPKAELFIAATVLPYAAGLGILLGGVLGGGLGGLVGVEKGIDIVKEFVEDGSLYVLEKKVSSISEKVAASG